MQYDLSMSENSNYTPDGKLLIRPIREQRAANTAKLMEAGVAERCEKMTRHLSVCLMFCTQLFF